MAYIKHIEASILEKFIKDVFIGLGVPENDAQVSANVLIESDLRGIESHGIGRLKTIYYDRIKDGIQNCETKVDIIRDNMTTAVIDGNNGMGHVVAKESMKLAIDKAKKYGMGMVVVRNSTHYGIAGYYASMAAKEGMISFNGTNARPSVAPTFGVEPMLGTNPITMGFPTDEPFDFILDCATSLTQRGKIEDYARKGKPVPEGWVVDKKGCALTNAEDILRLLSIGEAALAPLGGLGEDLSGYKGYGYSTMVEVLSSALQAGSYLKALSGIGLLGEKIPYPLGHFFIAINIENFIDLDKFKKHSGDILRELRTSKTATMKDRIYTAGEKESIARKRVLDSGVPITSITWEEINIMANELNVSIPESTDYSETSFECNEWV